MQSPLLCNFNLFWHSQVRAYICFIATENWLEHFTSLCTGAPSHAKEISRAALAQSRARKTQEITKKAQRVADLVCDLTLSMCNFLKYMRKMTYNNA